MKLTSDSWLDSQAVKILGLHQFMVMAWGQVEKHKFIDGWHLQELCLVFEALQRGDVRELVANQPPGSCKSRLFNVFGPAWVWTIDAREKIWGFSYDPNLAERDSLTMRALVTSDWYRERWPVRLAGLDQASYWENSAGGVRMATGIAGAATGWHADWLICDDPIKAKDVQDNGEGTRAALKEANHFFSQTLPTRARDHATCRKVLVMQRQHQADPAALRIEAGWTPVIFPMHYDDKNPCIFLGRKIDHRTEPDELLWPERIPAAAVDAMTKELGIYASGQLEQRPVPATGGMFKVEWFNPRWTLSGEIPGTVVLPKMHQDGLLSQEAISVDCSAKGLATSDWTVMLAVRKVGANIYVLDLIRGKWDINQTKDQLLAFCARHPTITKKLIEDKANGTPIISMLQSYVSGLEAVNPTKSKRDRALATTDLWSSGNVVLPHSSIAPWADEYITEHANFPNSRHDDQVDATSQVLNWLPREVEPKLVAAMRAMRGDNTGGSGFSWRQILTGT